MEGEDGLLIAGTRTRRGDREHGPTVERMVRRGLAGSAVEARTSRLRHAAREATIDRLASPLAVWHDALGVMGSVRNAADILDDVGDVLEGPGRRPGRGRR